MRYLILSLMVFAGLGFHGALAQEQKNEQPAWLKGMMDDATPEQQQHFYAIYSTHNLIGTVDVVRGDVERSAVLCAEAHADIKDKMTERYKAWNQEISTVLDEARAHVQNMVAVQEYAAAEDIQALLDDIDAERAKALETIDKVPLTTLESCSHLYETMEETQERFVQLLRQTLVSMPVFKAEAEEKEEAAAEPEAEDAAEPEEAPQPEE